MKLLAPLLLLCSIKIVRSSSASIGLEEVVSKENYRMYGQALEAIFSMGLRLQVVMDVADNENFVVSPLSATAIIAQLMIGADGEFREQLHDLLSLPKYSASFNVTHFSKERNESQILPYATFHLQLAILIKKLRRRKLGEKFTLNLDNALFYNQDIDLRTVFTTTLNKMYNTDVTPLDFRNNTSRIINQWASDHTRGLIKSFLSAPPPSSTASLFINSVYFLAEWETPFSDFLNNMDNFNINESQSVKALFMMGNMLDIPYAETKHYKIVCLPYKNRELGMYIILPTIRHEYKYNIKQFVASLDPKEVLKVLMNLKPHDVNIKIPKLSLTNTLSLLEPLQKYALFKKLEGNTSKTENNSIDEIVNRVRNFQNFSTSTRRDIYLENAATGANLRVSDIVQQIVFSVNEKGTEAAAISAGITDYMGGVKNLILNRPFSFFIRHEETQAILFWGTIVNPSKK